LSRRDWCARLPSVRVVAGLGVLAACWLVSVEGWTAGAYLAGLHGELGRGMLPACLALWALVLLVPLPLALWAAWPTLTRRRTLGSLAIGGAGLAIGAFYGHHSSQLAPTAAAPERFAEAELQGSLATLGSLRGELPPAPVPAPPLETRRTVTCTASPARTPFTLIVSFVARGRKARTQSACFQGTSLDTVLGELRGLLAERAVRGPVVLDLVSGWQSLPGRQSWLAALELRPGLDGVCSGGRCVLPWQLLAQGLFSTFHPVSFIPDFQFGIDPAEVWAALGVGADAGRGEGLVGLTRIATRSYALDLAAQVPTLTPLLRLRRRDPPLSPDSLARAAREAESHVLHAQLPDGRFRYTLDPLTGESDTQSFNLARQAGTTLALCELGDDSLEVKHAIEHSLDAFQSYERARGELSALTLEAGTNVARSNDSLLPLASFLGCAARLGAAPRASVAGLSRLLLRLQRPDGGFWPALNLDSGEAERGPDALYSGGQAVLALVLLEARQARQPDPSLPPLGVVHAAAERAMQYFATEYWSHPLRDFFFLEENWHCIAARAALPIHRHAGYEDFCRRYVRFKARLILDREQGADPDFDGGFGFGNLVPPHNTGAAGFGEALAAKLALDHADGLRSESDERLLGRVLTFLLRQHWWPENCFACATPEVVGGMSEHTHSLLTRIDFAQHAWSALGHGSEVLRTNLPPH
jgi:hypothetical protein